MARHWKLIALAGVTALVAGVVLWGQPPRSQRTRVAAPPATPSTSAASATGLGPKPVPGPFAADTAGPTTSVDGVPMGYSHDQHGARAAALTFVEMAESVIGMDEFAAEAAQRTMASTSAADALVADLKSKLARVRAGWPAGSLTYRVAPLAVRIVDQGPDSVKADVWYVGVVAGRNVVTSEQWSTESFHLVWERGDWRVDADTLVPGPRPDPGRQKSASAAELDARLVGFEAVR